VYKIWEIKHHEEISLQEKSQTNYNPSPSRKKDREKKLPAADFL
jgi:hypothetical protein